MKSRSRRKSPTKSRRRSNLKSSRKSRSGSRPKSSTKSRSGNKTNVIILERSKLPEKKYRVIIGNKTINFGAKTYSDYTIHKDEERMHRYVTRHKSRENWKKSGIKTAGFWSRWLLWNKPSFRGSINDIQKRFGVRITNRV